LPPRKSNWLNNLLLFPEKEAKSASLLQHNTGFYPQLKPIGLIDSSFSR
jgi:hypothetical protein